MAEQYFAYSVSPNGVTKYETKHTTGAKGHAYYFIHHNEVFCRIPIGKRDDGKIVLCGERHKYSNKTALMKHIKSADKIAHDAMTTPGPAKTVGGKPNNMSIIKVSKPLSNRSTAAKQEAALHFANQKVKFKAAEKEALLSTARLTDLGATEPNPAGGNHSDKPIASGSGTKHPRNVEDNAESNRALKRRASGSKSAAARGVQARNNVGAKINLRSKKAAGSHLTLEIFHWENDDEDEEAGA